MFSHLNLSWDLDLFYALGYNLWCFFDKRISFIRPTHTRTARCFFSLCGSIQPYKNCVVTPFGEKGEEAIYCRPGILMSKTAPGEHRIGKVKEPRVPWQSVSFLFFLFVAEKIIQMWNWEFKERSGLRSVPEGCQSSLPHSWGRCLCVCVYLHISFEFAKQLRLDMVSLETMQK